MTWVLLRLSLSRLAFIQVSTSTRHASRRSVEIKLPLAACTDTVASCRRSSIHCRTKSNKIVCHFEFTVRYIKIYGRFRRNATELRSVQENITWLTARQRSKFISTVCSKRDLNISKTKMNACHLWTRISNLEHALIKWSARIIC